MVTQIVGISLVRNEDIFISQAITNVAEFCDKIIVLDNLSTDNTWYEIQELKKQCLFFVFFYYLLALHSPHASQQSSQSMKR